MRLPWQTCRQDDLVEAAHRLLETLGYRSDRTLDLPGPVSEFIGAFPAPNQGTQTEMNFRARATSARVLFQFTDSEIAEAQPSHLDSGDFDTGNSSSFVFIAVELQDASYPRSAYVELTREINKRLSVARRRTFQNCRQPAQPGLRPSPPAQA